MIILAPKKRRAGLTVVELLVSLGLIVVLLSLGAVAVQRFQKMAKTMQCASNLRQIGVALTAYANEHNGYFPARWDEDREKDLETKTTWRQKLNPYFGLSADSSSHYLKIWFCPSAIVLPVTLRPKVGHYGYNYTIVSAAWARRQTAPPEPSKYVLVGECNRNNDSFDYRSLPALSGEVETANRFSHPNRTANYLFVDGHVEGRPYIDSNNPPQEMFRWW